MTKGELRYVLVSAYVQGFHAVNCRLSAEICDAPSILIVLIRCERRLLHHCILHGCLVTGFQASSGGRIVSGGNETSSLPFQGRHEVEVIESVNA